MTLSTGLWVKHNGNAGVKPVDARRALGSQYYETSPGIVRTGLHSTIPDFNLVTATGGWAYNLEAFPAFVIGRAANEGAYVLTGQGTTPTGQVAAAPAAGLSRWDLIYLKQNDIEKGDPDNLPVLGVAQGAAAASPTKPNASLPAGAVVIAEAQIFSGTTGTSAAPNTLTQVWRYTALKGAPLPIRTLTERAELSPRKGDTILRIDREDWVQKWNGTAWKYEGWRRGEEAPTWYNAAGASSRQIALISSVKPYARRLNLYGRSTIFCGTISTGREEINLAISAWVGQVTSAQGRARITWLPGFSGVDQSATVEAQNVSVGANSDAVVRLWIEVVSGAVNLTPSGPTYANLYYDYQPEAD